MEKSATNAVTSDLPLRGDCPRQACDRHSAAAPSAAAICELQSSRHVRHERLAGPEVGDAARAPVSRAVSVAAASSQLNRHNIARSGSVDRADAAASRHRTPRRRRSAAAASSASRARAGRNRRQVVARQHHAAGRVDRRRVETELVIGQIAGQHDRVGIVPPQAPVLPVAHAGSAAPWS